MFQIVFVSFIIFCCWHQIFLCDWIAIFSFFNALCLNQAFFLKGPDQVLLVYQKMCWESRGRQKKLKTIRRQSQRESEGSRDTDWQCGIYVEQGQGKTWQIPLWRDRQGHSGGDRDVRRAGHTQNFRDTCCQANKLSQLPLNLVTKLHFDSAGRGGGTFSYFSVTQKPYNTLSRCRFFKTKIVASPALEIGNAERGQRHCKY